MFSPPQVAHPADAKTIPMCLSHTLTLRSTHSHIVEHSHAQVNTHHINICTHEAVACVIPEGSQLCEADS